MPFLFSEKMPLLESHTDLSSPPYFLFFLDLGCFLGSPDEEDALAFLLGELLFLARGSVAGVVTSFDQNSVSTIDWAKIADHGEASVNP